VIDKPVTPFELSEHARTVIREREIEMAWIAETLSRPSRTERDVRDVSLVHALHAIPERNDRVLRVVYNERQRPWKVVTAFFDRRERRG
jgi:galactokinase